MIAASSAGTMHPRRYESYRRLRRLFEELTEARGPQKRGPESAALTASDDRLAARKRMRQRTAINILQLPAYGHTVSDPARADASPASQARPGNGQLPRPRLSGWSRESARARRLH